MGENINRIESVELVSNCCGVKIIENTDLCSNCKEHCEREDNISEVYNCDNMELMAKYPDGHFELAIVDPPYGIGFDKFVYSKGDGAKAKGFKENKNKIPKKNWDEEIPKKEYFEELFRVSKNQIIWGGNYFTEFLPPKMGWVYWHKKGNDGTKFSDGELAWSSFYRALKSFKYDWIGFGYINNAKDDKKIHPTQKPVALYKWLLTNYANEGDKILDTHLGSGSSRIACHDFKFDFVGCELDKDYFKAAEERYQEHIRQLTLF